MKIILRHYGPGIHKSGTPQSVHGKGGMAKWKAKQEVGLSAQPTPTLPNTLSTLTEPREIANDSEYVHLVNSENVDFITHADVARADELLDREFGEYYARLSDKQQRSLSNYGGLDYQQLNALHRVGDPPSNEARRILENPKLLSRLEQETLDIDSSLTHPMSEDTVVWRGMNSIYLGGNLSPGTVVIDKGYVSTSLRRQEAESFRDTRLWKGPGILCKVTIKKGAKCGVVLEPSRFKHEGIDYVNEEVEILLPRGQQFRITKVDEIRGTPSVVHLETIA